MKNPIVCILLLLASFISALAGPRVVVFQRDNSIFVSDLEGTNVKKLTDGNFPSVSPDGTRVAFNTEEKIGEKWVRHIAVIEIGNGKMTVFKDVPSENCYNATWSPDGKWIAFTFRRDDVWDLGLIKSNGSGFNVIKKGAPNEVTFYGPVWGRDKQSIFCQDMTNIYKLSLDGALVAQWKIDKIVANGDMSGDGRIDVSADGNHLLLSIDMGEEQNRKDWDGPPPALWSFDLTTQRAVRLTPKSLFAWDGCWLDNDNLLFLSQPKGEKEASIFRMSTSGKDLKRLFKDARMPSVSAP